MSLINASVDDGRMSNCNKENVAPVMKVGRAGGKSNLPKINKGLKIIMSCLFE